MGYYIHELKGKLAVPRWKVQFITYKKEDTRQSNAQKTRNLTAKSCEDHLAAHAKFFPEQFRYVTRGATWHSRTFTRLPNR